MSLSPNQHARWRSNLQAAGIVVDDETLKRVEPSAAARLDDLREALERLDCQAMNPDYLRDETSEEHAGGDA